jgi:aspartate aminotransferase
MMTPTTWGGFPILSIAGILRPMQLSRRAASLAPSATLAVSARIKALLAAGEDIIGFGTGEPDFDTPDNIKEAAIKSLREGNTKYTAVAGDQKAREAIANKLRTENGIQCTAEDVVISVGGKHSCYLALQCLLDPPANANEKPPEVILPTPAWVSYEPMIQLAGGIAVQVPGAVENDFLITPAQLEAAMSPRTKAVIFNSPSNPCGTMYSETQLRALVDVLKGHEHVAIITDEIYEKLTYSSVKHFSIGSMPEIAHRVITIGGMSKAYAMTGWRIGYTCAAGGSTGKGSPFVKAMANLQSQMTSNITSFCYPAIVEAITNSADSVERMRRAFASRAELIHRHFSAMKGVKCPKPSGAFYVFPDFSAYFGRTSPGGRKIDAALSFSAALLDEAKVAVVPGEDFGTIGINHVRLSFACSESHIEKGCTRLREWLERF